MARHDTTIDGAYAVAFKVRDDDPRVPCMIGQTSHGPSGRDDVRRIFLQLDSRVGHELPALCLAHRRALARLLIVETGMEGAE